MKAPIRIKNERNPYGKGWRLLVQFGATWRPFSSGAGYRAFTFPWYSPSIHSPRWRRMAYVSYLPGVTLCITRDAKVYRKPSGLAGTDRRPLWVQLHTNGNVRLVVPWWWS